MYLYSFLSTEFVKYGFSLKYCSKTSEFIVLFQTTKTANSTHEFKGEAPRLNRITGDPHILQVAEGNLIGIVYGVEREQSVVHESHRPELRDAFHDRTSLFVYRPEFLLSATLYEKSIQSAPLYSQSR